MTLVLLAAGAVWVTLLVFVWSLCAAAARGDAGRMQLPRQARERHPGEHRFSRDPHDRLLPSARQRARVR